MQADKQLDLTLFGATGFTGGLVADYLGERLDPDQLRLGLAGRSQEKLQEIKQRLVRKNPRFSSVKIVPAEAGDASSLVRMARDTRVILSTVGPYVHFGEALVRACVREGADYVDITGEPEFVDRMIDVYHDAAQGAKLRIVHCCGFDSVPSDLAALFTRQQLPAQGPIHMESFVQVRGSFSGGTWNSALAAMGRFRQYRTARQKRQQALTLAAKGRIGRTRGTIRFDRQVQAWVVPLPTIDPDVVLRSALLRSDYGPEFRYNVYGVAKSLPRLVGFGAGVGAVFLLSQLSPTRSLLSRIRKSGDGPDEAQRQRGWFRVTTVGVSGPDQVITVVHGGDPGYGETSKMVSEAALTLVQDRDRLPERHGVLTPAAAFGELLIDRLRQRGIAFETR